MKEKIVELIRRFKPMSSRSREWDFLLAGSGRLQRWHEIEEEHRALIIADPGAGKTFEAKTRARKMRDRGKKAFFIRIEKIHVSFDQAFEIGTAEEFAAWLGSTEEVWFFLDSVDEAQWRPRARWKMPSASSGREFMTRLRERTSSSRVAKMRGARCLTRR
jgi:hypothetical protein